MPGPDLPTAGPGLCPLEWSILLVLCGSQRLAEETIVNVIECVWVILGIQTIGLVFLPISGDVMINCTLCHSLNK